MCRLIFISFIAALLGMQPVLANEAVTGEALEKFNAGVKAFDLGEFEQARTHFESVEKLHNDHIDSIIYLARVNAKLEEWDDAGDFIETALELAPENAFAHNLSGKINGRIAREASIFTALGYAETSLSGFSKAVALEPENVDYHWDIIGFHLNAPGIAGGDKDIAHEHAKILASLSEKDGFLALLNVFESMENEEALEAHIDAISENLKNDAEVLFELGMKQQRRENFDDAFELLSQSIENSDTSPENQAILFAAIYQTGRTSVLSETNLEKGISSLNRFIEEAPSLDNLPSKEWARFRLANLLELNGSKKESKTIYQELAKQTKDKELRKRAKKKAR